MRQVHEVVRLQWAIGLSDRQSAPSRSLSRPTVAAYIRRAQAAGLSWPLPDGRDEAPRERRLCLPPPTKGAWTHQAPAWAQVHPERTRQGVTLLLLWQEDNAATPEGCQYSGVCHAYRHWAGKRDRGMRQSHRAGDKLFVADAGQGLPSVNRHSGAMHAAAVCIAVLGASHYTAAAAPWPQSLPDWMGSHVRTFAALGGVPEVVVPDPLKAAGNRAHRYEPESKRTEGDRAHHDGIAIMPARAARPRDKAPVEVGGQVVERWIVARLRNHTVFSRAEAKGARHDLLPARHARPFQQLPGSRPSLFASLDRPA